MSTTDIFMSSSPTRPSRSNQEQGSSSSPGIPALDDIFTFKGPQKSALRSGSNAAPIPVNAPTSFTSAADVFRDAPHVDVDAETLPTSPTRKKTATSKKQSEKQAVPRAARKTKDVSNPSKSRAAKDKPPNKNPAAGSSAKSDQPHSTVLQGRVTKPSTGSRKSETVSKHFADPLPKPKSAPKQRKTAPTKQSRKLSDPPPESAIEVSKTMEERPQTPEDLPQLPALARRNDWTPPPPDKSVVVLDSESDNRELLSSANKPAGSKGLFKTLHDQYGCKESGQDLQKPQEQAHQVPPPEQQRDADVLRKRKAIETISLEGSNNLDPKVPRERSPNKPAPTKRKIKTITELATAPYAMTPDADFDITLRSTRDSLLGYLDDGSDIKALIENQAVTMDQTKGKGKGKAKPAKEPKRKRKAGTANQPILLSPNSALKQSNGQDFVFGTSSQLMREESPTTLRDLQLAIQASNQNDGEDPFEDEDSQGLWRAGARDADGDLLAVEFVDLAGATVVPKFQRPSQRASKSPEMIQQTEVSPSHDRTLDLEDILDASDIERESRESAKNQEKLHSQPLQPPPSGQSAEATVAIGQPTKAKPKFDLLTDVQLSRQIASYGFKPIRRRQAMIALLDKCWTSQNGPGTVASTHTISTTATAMSPKRKAQTTSAAPKTSPARPRGRPRKDSSVPPPSSQLPTTNSRKSTSPKRKPQKAASAPVLASPGRPRGRPRKQQTDELPVLPEPVTGTSAKNPKSPKQSRAKSPPRKAKSIITPIEIADSESDDEMEVEIEDDCRSIAASSHHSTTSLERLLTPPPADDDPAEAGVDVSSLADPSSSSSILLQSSQERLFLHITRAVTSCPRSSDPSQPSWHEKMLLYDPVVLEDLAAWLNTGQLSRAGFDGEVSPSDVKGWCESKSVVYVWRQTLKGRERSRF